MMEKISLSFPEEIEEIIWMDAKIAEKYAYIPTEVKGLINSKSIISYILRGKVVHIVQLTGARVEEDIVDFCLFLLS